MKSAIAGLLILVAALGICNVAKADNFHAFYEVEAQNGYQCLAEAMYFEGAKDGKFGMYLIGNVIINRYTDHELEFKKLNTICDVVHQPSRDPLKPWECAFSYYCDGKPEIIPENPVEEAAAEVARHLAMSMLNTHNTNGYIIDFTDGALYYTQPQINREWMANTTVTFTFLNHVFRKPLEKE